MSLPRLLQTLSTPTLVEERNIRPEKAIPHIMLANKFWQNFSLYFGITEHVSVYILHCDISSLLTSFHLRGVLGP